MKISVEFKSDLSSQGLLCVFQNIKGKKFALDKIANDFCPSFLDGEKKLSAPVTVTAGGKMVLVTPIHTDKAYSPLEFVRSLGAGMARLTRDWEEVAIGYSSLSFQDSAQVAFGFLLASYQFDKYKDHKTKSKTKKLTVFSQDPKRSEALFRRLSFVLDGIFFTRNLANEPANIMTPTEFVTRCKASLQPLGVKLTVLKEKEMKKLGFGALLGVGQGSTQESHALIMEWQGGSGGKPVALVGKGVTFDTGGISIKPSRRMEDMVFDMCGAAAVAGTMLALAQGNAKVNVVGAVGLVENMPGGNAQRPGDVVRSYSGKTIQVLNTDAEGRLVLADVLSYVQKKFSPSTVIDLATLTGAVVVALGDRYAALCSNSDGLCKALTRSGEESGDLVWRLPLNEYYNKSMNSPVADVANIETVRIGAGTITAAEFLQRFIEKDVDWAHLDIAGTATVERPAATCKYGSTGFGVAILERFLLGDY